MRLGLALGKSRQEIRQLPYPEYKQWKLLYLIEPWGFEDREYRTAALIATLHNVNAGKRGDMKSPKDFMRDMPALVYQELERMDQENNPPDLSRMPAEERDELIRKSMKAFFGVT